MKSYKVLGAEVGDDNIATIPDELEPLSVMYHPTTLKLMIVCLQEVKEEPKAKERKLGKTAEEKAAEEKAAEEKAKEEASGH